MTREQLLEKLKQLHQLTKNWVDSQAALETLKKQRQIYYEENKPVHPLWWLRPWTSIGFIWAFLQIHDFIIVFWPNTEYIFGVHLSIVTRFIAIPAVLLLITGIPFAYNSKASTRRRISEKNKEFESAQHLARMRHQTGIKIAQSGYAELGGENFYPSSQLQPSIIFDVHNLIADHRASSVGEALNLRDRLVQQQNRDRQQRQHNARVIQNQKNAMRAQLMSDMATQWAIDDLRRGR